MNFSSLGRKLKQKFELLRNFELQFQIKQVLLYNTVTISTSESR
jgi:hypothetical protein